MCKTIETNQLEIKVECSNCGCINWNHYHPIYICINCGKVFKLIIDDNNNCDLTISMKQLFYQENNNDISKHSKKYIISNNKLITNLKQLKDMSDIEIWCDYT